jgi:hypothetical protein
VPTSTGRSGAPAPGALRVSVGGSIGVRDGRLRLAVSCSRRCAGWIVIETRALSIARTEIALRRRGFSGTVTAPLGPRARRAVSSAGLLHATAVVDLNGSVSDHAVTLSERPPSG